MAGRTKPSASATGRSFATSLERLEDRLALAAIGFSSPFYAAVETAGLAAVTVNRDGVSATAETVRVATQDLAAVAGVRYAAFSQDLTFQPNETSKEIHITILDDSALNHNQSLKLVLSDPRGGAQLSAQSTALLTVLDDERPYDVSLLQRPNAVVIAGRGTNSMQFLPDGGLALLLWVGQEDSSQGSFNAQHLTYLHRSGFGEWQSEVVTDNLSIFGGTTDGFDPQLLIDPAGTPHVLILGFDYDDNFQRTELVVHYRREASGWTRVETIDVGLHGSGFDTSMAATIGPGGALHFVVAGDSGISETAATNVLMYGTNKSGSWAVQAVTPLGNQRYGFSYPSGIRYLSIAADSQNFAHVSYTPDFKDNTPPGQFFFSRPFSQLGYASNRSGAWVTQIVYQPSDDSGDAGLGSSVAVGPGDQVGIASFYVERVGTGSASSAQLLYHQRFPNGQFATQVVTSTPDGYAAGDGPRFTGWLPQLKFDAAGRPNIVFSDFATQHFPEFGAAEYSGQLRHAVHNGASWILETIIRQTDPLLNELASPNFIAGPGGNVYSGLLISYAGNVQTTTYALVARDSGSRFAQRLAQIASIFTHSDENYRNIIAKAYDQYLKRMPDEAGTAYWVGRMRGGLTDEQLEANFLGALEYVSSHGGVDEHGVARPEWVAGMYRDLLGREADAGGLAHWSGQIAAGVTPYDIALGFAASPERERTRIGDNYFRYLDRLADEGGVNFWLNEFLNGKTNEDLAAGFIGSAEYFYNHGRGDLRHWVQALYLEVLHRAASQAEIDGWVAFVNGP